MEQSSVQAEIADLHRVNFRGSELLLLGTAHISAESARLVQEVIERERPSRVLVELDPRRLEALRNPDRWRSLDLREVMRRKQLPTLIANLVLASYQRRLGQETGTLPGTELLQAVTAAEAAGIPVEVVDRDIKITLSRAWGLTPWWKRMGLLSVLLSSLFEREKMDEAQLTALRSDDTLGSLLAELGQALPTLKRVLIDERDLWMAAALRKSSGNSGEKVLLVAGAGHIPGILALLEQDREIDLAPLSLVPPASNVGKAFAWGIPLALIGSVIWMGFHDSAAARDSALTYALATGIPCAIGALLALAHPLVIVVGALCAPFAALNPLIGAGYITGALQLWLRPPQVSDLEQLPDEIPHLSRWWKNGALRVFLAFLLPSIGTMIGNFVGGYEVISRLMQTLGR